MTGTSPSAARSRQTEKHAQRLESTGWRPEYGAVLGVLRHHRVGRGARLLDYGCGLGDLTAALAAAGYRPLGVEVSLSLLERARGRHPGIPFAALGPGFELPLAGQGFEAITAVNTLEHVLRPAAALRDMARVLQPGGLLVLTLPNLLSPLRPFKRLLAWPRRPKYGPESGESTWEALALLRRDLALLATISLTRRPQFRRRQADFDNAEHFRQLGYGADYDALWLANPLDVAWQLRALRLDVLDMRGIPGAADDRGIVRQLRQILPPALTSPVLLVARQRGHVTG